jgi:hypothetical protein
VHHRGPIVGVVVALAPSGIDYVPRESRKSGCLKWKVEVQKGI